MSVPLFPTRERVSLSPEPSATTEEQVLLGFHAEDELPDPDGVRSKRRLGRRGEPIYVSRDLLADGHTHVIGSTGCGKSSLIMAPLVLSVMKPYRDRHGELQRDPIFVFDFGKDLGLFNRVREAAIGMGRRFRYFNMSPEQSYTFNPFQAVSKGNSRSVRIANLWMEGLGLEQSGNASGDSQFFAQQNLIQVLKLVEASTRAASSGSDVGLLDLREYLDDKDIAVKHADGVRTNLELLLRYTQLTATDKSYEINLRDSILNGDAVYFYTPAMGELQCSRAISGLALYTLINAAMELDEEGTPFNRPHVFIDEWQMLAGENIGAVLSLGRKLLSLLLANQTVRQLTPDMAALVEDNCFLRILFNATVEDDVRMLQRHSKTHPENWLRQERDSLGGLTTGSIQASGSSYSQFVDSQLTANKILDVSFTDKQFFIVLNDGLGHREPIVAYRDHEISFAEFDRQRTTPIEKVPWKRDAELHATDSATPSWHANHLAPATGDRIVRQGAMLQIIRQKLHALYG